MIWAVLIGLLIAIAILSVSVCISYFACVMISELIDHISEYINLKRLFMFIVFLVLIHFLYTGITERVVMLFE